MTIKDYLQKVELIRQHEFISATDLAKRLDISYATWVRINRNPDICSFKTARKIKVFVTQWEEQPLNERGISIH